MTDRTRGRLFVLGQFVLLGLLIVLPHGDLWFVTAELGSFAVALVIAGFVVTLMGVASLGNSITATPVPKASAELRTTGLYAIVRHPIYLGLLIIATGLAVMSSSWWGIVTFFALGVVLHFKAAFEEHLLRQKFPGYAAYAARVGRIIPMIGRIPADKSSN